MCRDFSAKPRIPGAAVQVYARHRISRDAQPQVQGKHALARAAAGDEQAGSAERQDAVDQPLLFRSFSKIRLSTEPVGQPGDTRMRRHLLAHLVEAFADLQVVEVSRIPREVTETGRDDTAAHGIGCASGVFHAWVPGSALFLCPLVVVCTDDDAGLREHLPDDGCDLGQISCIESGHHGIAGSGMQ